MRSIAPDPNAARFARDLVLQASVRKSMLGYELLSEPRRDLTPEDAAGRLRDALAG